MKGFYCVFREKVLYKIDRGTDRKVLKKYCFYCKVTEFCFSLLNLWSDADEIYNPQASFSSLPYLKCATSKLDCAAAVF